MLKLLVAMGDEKHKGIIITNGIAFVAVGQFPFVSWTLASFHYAHVSLEHKSGRV